MEDFKVENLILPEISEKLNRNIRLMYQIIGTMLTGMISGTISLLKLIILLIILMNLVQ